MLLPGFSQSCLNPWQCTQRSIMSPNCLPTCWKSACQTQTQTEWGEANIFQFDFHLHLEFFLHENYFRLAVIYRILLRRNASCHASTATVAATFVSLTAMQSLHQFIDQLAGLRSVCASKCVCVHVGCLISGPLCAPFGLQMSDAPSFKANIKFAAHPSRKSNRQRIKLKSHESNQIFNSKPIKTTL